MRKPRRLNAPFPERFWAKVTKPADPTACWGWTAATVRGYGCIGRGRATEGTVLAHRASWELHNGPIPEGKQVLHRCDNPPCTNPAHLFLGDPRANSDDREAKGRGQRHQTLKTHCYAGHEFTPENTRTVVRQKKDRSRPAIERKCRACDREYQRQQRASA